MPGFEPGTSYMQSKRSTTELHPRCGWKAPDQFHLQNFINFFYTVIRVINVQK